MSITVPLLTLFASVILASPLYASENEGQPSPHPREVRVSAEDLDLSRASEREKLIERSLELARHSCAVRDDQSTPCHVDIVVSKGGRPKWLKQTYREYLARR